MEHKRNVKSTQTVTFRIDSRTLRKLKNHANFEQRTLNTIVNQLLSQTVNWDIAAARSGWVPVERSVLRAILDSLDETVIVEIAKMAGNNIAKDMAISMTGNFGVLEWITILSLRSKAAGFGFTQVEERGFVTFVMRHNIGKRCSLHWKTFYEYGFRHLNCPVKIKCTENTVVYKIPKKYLDDSIQ